MQVKNNRRGKVNLFLWYSSGLNLRDLFGNSRSESNYFAIGGINVFSTLVTFILSTTSIIIAFPKVFIGISVFIGLLMSLLVYIFNRQTINALSHTDVGVRKQNLLLTLFPLFLFAIFSGVLLSISLKFKLFEIEENQNFFYRIKKLSAFTRSDISAQIISWSISLLISSVMALPTLMQYFSIRNKTRGNRSSLLNELMWYCSGANKEIIRKCSNDHSKYFGIGGTILFTALMATLSGGYAFFTAFNSSSLAICFGIFWGAMIFNLDRFIVNTMYTDNKHTISGLEILSGLPRLVIAIFLGIVISYPLELKLFEDEINVRIEKLKVENLKTYNDTLEAAFSVISSNNVEIKTLDTKKDKLQTEIDMAKQDWDAIKKVPRKGKKWDNEQGRNIQYTYYVWPDEYYKKKKDYEDLKARNEIDITDIRNKKKDIESKTQAIEKVKSGYETSHNKENIALNDFSTRMEAFEKLKEEKSSIRTASLFIMLLLIIIEIAPVLFKMMLASGDYDVVIEAEKNKIKIEEAVRMSQQNDWANTEITKLVEENKKLIRAKENELNAELQANEELLKSIALAQSEIAQIAITKWKEMEIKKASDNPSDFLKINSGNMS